MRRKFTSLVMPPVATITPFLARMRTLGLVLSILPSERKLFSGVDCPGMIARRVLGADTDHRAALLPLADEAGHLVVEQKLHALFARAVFQWPNHSGAWPRVGTFEAGAFGPKGMILPRRRIAQIVTALIVGRDRLEFTPLSMRNS